MFSNTIKTDDKVEIIAYEMKFSTEEIAAKLGMEKEDVEKIIDESRSV
jgi:DNA-directed RNA polymerase specialized sigma subunit